ncbi:hypothetical protein [Faecalibaculum rodentium]|uniref:hypothetical protein n=1 Tax=Faecalibaculum rodentium TaxID=1702221 RepID=UPI0025A67C7D|nr:hypothetical protein [Faecalibaculum rodentium]
MKHIEVRTPKGNLRSQMIYRKSDGLELSVALLIAEAIWNDKSPRAERVETPAMVEDYMERITDTVLDLLDEKCAWRDAKLEEYDD